MINKVQLIGRLGKDPDLRYTQSGSAVANFSIATSEVWKDKSGDKQERTEWHNVVVWEKQAESCAEYLKKGSLAYIEGKLQTRSWEDQEGNKRYKTEILAQTVKFLDFQKTQEVEQTSSSAPAYQNRVVEDDVPF